MLTSGFKMKKKEINKKKERLNNIKESDIYKTKYSIYRERKNIENQVTTGTGYLSSQVKQIRKVNNAILEWWNGLDLKL